MSRLAVHFVGPVRRPGPERTLELPRGSLETVGDLLEQLGYTPGERQGLHVLVDGTRRSPDESLDGATRVEILVASGGG